MTDSEIRVGGNTYPVETYQVEQGALIEVPCWRDPEWDKRANNWASKIVPNPRARGGFDRDFLEKAEGDYFYFINKLQRGDAVEFAADTHSNKHLYPDRHYFAVVEVREDTLILIRCKTGREAYKIGRLLQQEAKK